MSSTPVTMAIVLLDISIAMALSNVLKEMMNVMIAVNYALTLHHRFILIVHLAYSLHVRSAACNDAWHIQCDVSGECISKSLRCDSVNNCGDFSDEQDCPPCNEDQNEFRCNIGRYVGNVVAFI